MSPETDLLRRAQAGDARAEDQLLARLHRRLSSRLARWPGDPHEHEDIVQETLITVWQRLAELRDGNSLSAWAHRILRNRWAEHARRRARRPPAVEEFEVFEIREPGGEVCVRERGARLLTLLERLPEPQRHAIECGVLLGLPTRQAARRLGVSPSTFRRRFRRGASRLRGWMREGGRREEEAPFREARRGEGFGALDETGE